MILYLAADLLWSTKIRSTGDELAVPMRPVRNIDMLEARLTDSPVRALLVDLEVPEIPLKMIRRLRGEQATPAQRDIRIVAWGPHVESELLAAAQAAGADAVMPRGAFAARLPSILQSLMPTRVRAGLGDSDTSPETPACP